MTYLATALWPWLAAAGLLGLLIGAATARGRRPVETRRGGFVLDVMAWGVMALLSIGVAAVIFHWLDGRHGLWLDMTMAMTGTYILGCVAGALLRRALGREPAGVRAQPEAALAVTETETAGHKDAMASSPVIQPVMAPPASAGTPDEIAAPLPAKVGEPAASKPEPAGNGEARTDMSAAGKPPKPRQTRARKGKAPSGKPAKTGAAAAPSAPADAVEPPARARKPRSKGAGGSASRSRSGSKPKA